jgi:hypothetical protein
MSLDVWRFVTCGKGVASEHRGNQLFEKDELARFKYLPEDWWYYINQDGEELLWTSLSRQDQCCRVHHKNLSKKVVN